MTSTSINQAEISNGNGTIVDDQDNGTTLQAPAENRGRPETELRAAARRRGLTLKDLASQTGVNYSHLCSVSHGRRPWTPDLREKVAAVLGEVPGQGIVYRRGGPANGESSFIREQARAKGLNLKDLAERVGVTAGYMTDVSRGRRNMSPALQSRVESVLGGPVEIAPAVCAERPPVVLGIGSTYVRERARELGMSLRELAQACWGAASATSAMVARGLRNMSPALQARVEEELGGPVKVEAAQRSVVDPQALWARMDAHGISQNEAARRAGISPSHLSHIMHGTRIASGPVLRKLHEVLFRPSASELVAPAEVKVVAWKKDDRRGVVVKGAGGPGAGGNNPGGGTVRIGGRVPWGAEVEYAYRAGYDSRGRVSVTPMVDERGYGVLLAKPEQGEA